MVLLGLGSKTLTPKLWNKEGKGMDSAHIPDCDFSSR